MPAASEFFSRFKNRVFIESGTHCGGGVNAAIAAGFGKIISIELCPVRFDENVKRFAGNEKVKIVFGDSGVVLADVLKDVDCQCTFWLDGHYSDPTTAHGPDASPVLRELSCIKAHHINTHTILIDDVRTMGGPMFDNTHLGAIAEKLWEINKKYFLSLQTGQKEFPDDILVASI